MATYLDFVEVAPPDSSRAATRTWQVTNTRNEMLGEIKWYSPWRRYVLVIFDANVTFDAACLVQIATFLTEQTNEQKKTWRRPAARVPRR